MRICLVAFICIALSLNFACADLPLSLSKPDQVVLEVVTNASGNAYPKEGEVLDFRLYESGLFEYDDYPDWDPHRVQPNLIIIRKQAKLSHEEVSELMRLAKQPDFLNASESYAPPKPYLTDASFTNVITYKHEGREKRIEVHNYYSHYREFESYYPASLRGLFQRVRELRAEARGRN